MPTLEDEEMKPNLRPKGWHVDPTISVGNLIVAATALLSGIIAFADFKVWTNSMEYRVAATERQLGDQQSRIEATAKAQQDTAVVLHELKTILQIEKRLPKE